MKKVFLLIFILIVSIFAKPEFIFINNNQSKKDIYSNFLFDMLNLNLKDKVEFANDEKKNKFKILNSRYQDFYVTARKFQENYDFNGFICSLSFKNNKDKVFKTHLEIYDTNSRRIILKDDLRFKPEKLLENSKKILLKIAGSAGILVDFTNTTNIDNSKVLSAYLKLLRYKKKKQFNLYFDELEFLSNWFEKFPILKKMYDEEIKRQNSFYLNKKNIFEHNPNTIIKENNSFLANGNSDDPTESFLRKLMLNGYRLTFFDDVTTSADKDSTEFNIKVVYKLHFSKLYQALLNKRVKQNGYINKFKQFGRYEFSSNEEDNALFINLLKKQAIVLQLLDNENKVIAENEYFVEESDFDSGRYRHAIELPFPLTPQGSASNSYKINKNCAVYFNFENLHKDKLKQVKSSKLKFKLMD